MATATVDKKISMSLVGINGNAHALMGAFKKQALREEWSKDEIKIVLDEAMSSDYNHLIGTLDSYCKD